MTTSTLNIPQRGWFDVLDDWTLNEIALSLWVGLDSFFFPLLIWQLVGITALLALRLSQVGTPTVSQVVTLRVLIFSQRLCQRLLMLWVILFFYFGVLSLREISNATPTWGTLEFCGAPRCLRPNRFHATSV